MTTTPSIRPLAVVTGASSGIGLELARCCAQGGYDLVLAADQPLGEAAVSCQALGAAVQTLELDLADREGVDKLVSAIAGRHVEVLIANAGHGLGKSFFEQDFGDIEHVIATNITGTLYLLHTVGAAMCVQAGGKILITGSIAGFMPGSFQAVYNGTKAFIDSFAAALRNELKDSGVSVTCLMPGATDTEFFERADMLDTKVGTEKKMAPAEVASMGYKAMQDGEADVVAGLKNKLQVMLAKMLPSQVMAEQHRKQAQPGTAQKD